MSNRKNLSSSWSERKRRLQTLLDCCGDEEEEGIALDRIIHGQTVIGKTSKSGIIDEVRFSDKDLQSFGPLADAQFGTVELVSCQMDGRVYVRKRVSKKFALKTREQYSPNTERHILLLALKSRTSSSCTPQMLCAYQCPSFLNIVMEYASGGSLWDVLESSGSGRLAPADLMWWIPQCVASLDWIHSRAGFAHRDVKPHNFVVRLGKVPRLLLIDFGSAAPLLDKDTKGVQLIRREHCVVPCGTCDYISPEILRAHEEALVALEMSDNEEEDESDAELKLRNVAQSKILRDGKGYGRETDWWSLGAMLYELAFGSAPFFANDIRQTYAKIMNHQSNLKFDRKLLVPPPLVSFIKGCLSHHESRLGRFSDDDIKKHPYFRGIDWSDVHNRIPSPDLLLPQFTYATPLVPPSADEDKSESSQDGSKPFAFSALFQSSVTSRESMTPSRSLVSSNLTTPAFARRSLSRSASASATDSTQRSLASFIGFSWGPPKDAFDDATRTVPAEPASTEPGLSFPPSAPTADITVDITENNSQPHQHPFITPMRPSNARLGYGTGSSAVPPSTVRVTASAKRSSQIRPVSDREAMRMLVDCVGMSARKRVLESGKKPRVLLPDNGFGPPPPPLSMDFSGKENSDSTVTVSGRYAFGGSSTSSLRRKKPPPTMSMSRTGSFTTPNLNSNSKGDTNTIRKELRFDDTTTHIAPNPEFSNSYSNTFTGTLSRSDSHSNSTIGFTSILPTSTPRPPSNTAPGHAQGAGTATETETETETGSECPPSPSPSPRPGSAMSMLSISRRSATPTVSSAYLMRSSSEPLDNTTITFGRPGGLGRTRSGSSVSLSGFGTGGASTSGASANISAVPVITGQKNVNRRDMYGSEGDEDKENKERGGLETKTPKKAKSKARFAEPDPESPSQSISASLSQGRFGFGAASTPMPNRGRGRGGKKPLVSTPHPLSRGGLTDDNEDSEDGNIEETVGEEEKTTETEDREAPRPRFKETDSINGGEETFEREMRMAMDTPRPRIRVGGGQAAKQKGTPHPGFKKPGNLALGGANNGEVVGVGKKNVFAPSMSTSTPARTRKAQSGIARAQTFATMDDSVEADENDGDEVDLTKPPGENEDKSDLDEEDRTVMSRPGAELNRAEAGIEADSFMFDLPELFVAVAEPRLPRAEDIRDRIQNPSRGPGGFYDASDRDEDSQDEVDNTAVRNERSYSRSYCPGHNTEEYEGYAMYEEMEKRFERLRADIANVQAHVEEFARVAGVTARA